MGSSPSSIASIQQSPGILEQHPQEEILMLQNGTSSPSVVVSSSVSSPIVVNSSTSPSCSSVAIPLGEKTTSAHYTGKKRHRVRTGQH
ncbi:unnamed protein product [Lepeophtheirus salmonis]|uniref:(salmon louse) hypothetical protein n=1 Tax=Lepeophtheirus salmonis TaxID=72036 RepID=A0A7R8H480_LEPSM|nr:unnamed protein product [Lepeophtheirus salmonis]CAF2854458.1 unnamed protein product [Lepeophtheirus salmonis]